MIVKDYYHMNKRQDRENESEGICGLRFNKWAERLYFHR